MGSKLFYWLKSYLGFSNKESKGFLLLIPFLTLLVVSPIILQEIRAHRSENFHAQVLLELDSLEKAGMTRVKSPGPLFNPQDTVKKSPLSKQLDHIQKISFIEADSILLQIVPGIGPGTAGRIIRYRADLGGFHSSDQLNEVYGLNPETIALMWEFFEFNPQIYRKINLNESTVEQLSVHPYVTYGEAKVIVAYRNQHGKYQSVEELLKIKIFKKEWIQKLSPYLDLS
jgi:competence protein ComEA